MYEHDYLCHYGILGMKWGVRRYQNPDGSLTEEGKLRYGLSDKTRSKQEAAINSLYDRANANAKKSIETLKARGKTKQAKALKYLISENERNRKEKIKNLKSMKTKSDLRKARRSDRLKFIIGMDIAHVENRSLTSSLSRLDERFVQSLMKSYISSYPEKTIDFLGVADTYDLARSSAAMPAQYWKTGLLGALPLNIAKRN